MCKNLLTNLPYTLYGGTLIALILTLPVVTRAQSSADLIKAQELLSVGNALLQKGEAEQAAIQFGKVIELLPSLAVGYINRGLAYASAARYGDALSDAEKALTLAPKGPNPKTYQAMAHQIKGHVYQAQGENKLAVEAYSVSIDLEPSNAKFRNGRGVSYMLLEQNELALLDFGKAIELDATLPHTYVNRAIIHRRSKDFAAAARDLDVAINLNPTSASAHNNRANNYLDLKKYNEAIEDYTQAISLEPRSEYFYNRGRAYIDQGNFHSSIQDNAEAIKRDSNNHKAFHNRAISYHRLGKNDLAIEDLRKALLLNEKSSSMRYNLPTYYLKAVNMPKQAARQLY